MTTLRDFAYFRDKLHTDINGNYYLQGGSNLAAANLAAKRDKKLN